MNHAIAGSKVSPVFGSAGMLAVRERWRKRRDVIRAMYKVAAGVCASSDVTHVVAAVNHQTANMYRRLGFNSLTEKLWVDEIGEYIIPLATTAEEFCEWAFRDLPRTPLTVFKDSFERLFLRAGEEIFSEGDEGREAYIIQSGNVRITCRREGSIESPQDIVFWVRRDPRSGLMRRTRRPSRRPKRLAAPLPLQASTPNDYCVPFPQRITWAV